MSLMGVVRDGLLQKHLAGLKVSLALEGSRHFRGPKGLGLMPFEGCQIVIFEDEAKWGLQAAMKVLMQKAPKTIELAAKEVAVYEEKWENDIWTVFFTQPKPGILLCATHRGYLKEVLKRMEGKHPTRALPKHLPELFQIYRPHAIHPTCKALVQSRKKRILSHSAERVCRCGHGDDH